MIDVTVEQETILLSGELTRHTLMQIPSHIVKSMASKTNALVDLKNVSKVDTAGLAWLFYLLEQAQLANCQLRFANLPSKLDNLINLSSVEGFLPK